MAKYDIKHSNGTTIASGCPKYSGAYGKPAYLEFTISSPSPIAFVVGDYVDYRNLRYRLYSVPEPKKQAGNGKVGDSFLYQNLQFHEAPRDLEDAIFTDLVANGGEYFFSSRKETSTYENLAGIISRLQECADRYASLPWTFKKCTGFDGNADLAAVANEPKEFPISGQTILEACNQVAEIFTGVGWTYYYNSTTQKHEIQFGAPNIRSVAGTTGTFKYGKDNGLVSLKKYLTNKDKLVTRLYAYGAEKNLPLRYYNGKSIASAASVDIPNLMIPISHWGLDDGGNPDARRAFIQDNNKVGASGLIPRKVYFDDIYPTIKGMTIGGIENALDPGTLTDITYHSPNRTVYPTDSERVDVLKGASNPSDNGDLGDDTQRTISGSFLIPSQSFTAALEEDGDGKNVNVAVKTFAFSGLTTKGTFAFSPMNGNAIAYLVVDAFDPQIGSTIPWTDDTDFEDYVSFDFRLEIGGIGSAPVECSYMRDVTVSGRTCFMYAVRLPNTLYINTSDADLDSLTMRLVGGVNWKSVYMDTAITYTLGITTGSKLEDENALDWVFTYDKVTRSKVVLKQIGFDLNDVTATNGAHGTLNMLDGMCGGRSFTIKRCEYDSIADSYTLTIERIQDDSTGMLYPNATFGLAAGDHFVLTDIYMPELYIAYAENILWDEAQSYYDINSGPKFLYTPEVDSAKIADGTFTMPRAGMYMAIQDAEITGGTTEYILIDSVTISEGESNIPIVGVTLRERLDVPSAGS